MDAKATGTGRPWGAFPQPDGSTLFRLWAPEAAPGMTLRVEGHPPLPVAPDAQGYAEWIVGDCPPGTRYRYGLKDGTRMPDPASRLQDGDVHDASIVFDPATFEWRHDGWRPQPWEESVVYEVHVGLAGGFTGLRARLPELASLGINVLELMPIADFPGSRNWGYDGVLHYAPDRAYGSPLELQQLIDGAHGLGMSVMLDVAYNHFGPVGNYLAQYARSFFHADRHTPWGAEIDFSQPAVRRYFEDNALWWLDTYRFDGLRLDAVHEIKDEAWLQALPQRLRARLPGRRVHLVIEDDSNRRVLLDCGYDAQWNDDLHHVLHHLVSEENQSYDAYYQAPAHLLTQCLSAGWYDERRSLKTNGSTPLPCDARLGRLPPSAFVFFLQNHDQIGNRARGERLNSLAATADRMRAAITLQLLAPMVPMLFMGEEYAARSPFLYFTNHTDPALAKAVRDGRAREFARMPGFDLPASALPDPNAQATYDLSVPWPRNGENHDWTVFYAHLLALRAHLLAPRLFGTRAEGTTVLGPAAAQATWRMGDGAELSLFVNLSAVGCDVPPDIRPDEADSWLLIFESVVGALPTLQEGNLPGDCALWLIKEAPCIP